MTSLGGVVNKLTLPFVHCSKIKMDKVQLRGAAVKALVGQWDKQRYLEEATQILHTDPEWGARADAAVALSMFTRFSGQQRESILRELTRALIRDEDCAVQKRCYKELLQILAPSKSVTSIPDYFDRSRDVDWELLKPYLDNQVA